MRKSNSVEFESFQVQRIAAGLLTRPLPSRAGPPGCTLCPPDDCNVAQYGG